MKILNFDFVHSTDVFYCGDFVSAVQGLSKWIGYRKFRTKFEAIFGVTKNKNVKTFF